MPRILHLLDHSLPLHSGYSFRTAAILREQRARGWATFHVTSSKQGSPLTEETSEGLDFFRTQPHALLGRLPVLNQLDVIATLADRVTGLVQTLRPDILHAHSPCLTGIAALRVGRRLGLPVAYELRALWEDGAVSHGTTRQDSVRYRLSRALETWTLRRVDEITTICEGLRSNIIARGIAADRVTVIPNAMEESVISQDPAGALALRNRLGGAGRRLVGFMGSYYGYEGLDDLVAAAALLAARRRDFRIVLAGGGPEEAALRDLVKQRNLTDFVLFAGRIPHTEIGAYYAAMDLLVYPRKSNPLTETVTPLKPLEAMANGKPVLASDVGGHRELIRDGVTGMLFAPANAAALCAALDNAFGNPQLSQIAEAGRQFVNAERTWARSVARYEAVYARMLDR